MFNLELHSVRIDEDTQERAVVMKTIDYGAEHHYLAIWTDRRVALAILDGYDDVTYERPTVHDVLANSYKVIQRMGGTVEFVVIDDITEDGNYMARIMLDINGSKGAVRARPTDAIALAARLKIPVRASVAVLEAAGTPESELPFDPTIVG